MLLGGGTLINPGYVREVQEALDFGLPVSSLGTGVGSCGFSQPETVNITEWKALLRAFKQLGVRGPRSRTMLGALDVPGVEVIGDLALGLTLTNPLSHPIRPP